VLAFLDISEWHLIGTLDGFLVGRTDHLVHGVVGLSSKFLVVGEVNYLSAV
jgi:hypothetical protein